jgi:pSer/pThr/pTyr-binding forkhead associated (FHA) protein
LKDLGSKNGTWVNGTKVTSGHQVPLLDLDVLRFGSLEARFLFPESLYLYLRTDAH